MQFVVSGTMPYKLSPSMRPQRSAASCEPAWVTPTPPQTAELRAAARAAKQAFSRVLASAARKLPGNPTAALAIEQGLLNDVARQCLDPFVAVALQAAHDSPEVAAQARAIARAVPGLVSQEIREVEVTLLGGSKIRLTTRYYLRRLNKSKPRPGRKRGLGKRGRAGNGCYPFLMVLGIHHGITPALASEVARLAVQGTYEEAAAGLAVRGVVLAAKQVGNVVKRLSEQALAHRRWCVEQTKIGGRGSGGRLRGKRIVIGVDGGRLRIREKTKRGRRRKSGRRGFVATWREPKVFIIYEIDSQGRKRKRGFVRQDATLGDANALFELLAAKLFQIGASEASAWIIVGDGAEWIWNRIAELAAIVGYPLEKVTEVVDFYHAVEHLSTVAEHVTGKERRRLWMRKAKDLLKAGQISQLVTLIESLCKGRNAKKIRKGISYFRDNAARMAYRKFKRRGIPRGSGAVESCIRRVVNLRLKGNSIYWRPDTAEALLHARAQLLSGQWAQFIAQALQPQCFWTLERYAA